MKIKLKTIQNTENESDDEEDKSTIKVEENRVYFHADVTRENCIKLIESLQKFAGLVRALGIAYF